LRQLEADVEPRRFADGDDDLFVLGFRRHLWDDPGGAGRRQP
jgi:hypothetical protein